MVTRYNQHPNPPKPRLKAEQRADELAALLNQIKSAHIPTWPGDFCRRAKISKSTLGRHAAIARAVNEYGWQSAPRRMRPSPVMGQAATKEQRADRGVPRGTTTGWKQEKEQLHKQLLEAEKRITALLSSEKASGQRIATLENYIDVLVWRLARLDKKLGPELESLLRESDRAHYGDRNGGVPIPEKLGEVE